MQDEAVLNGLVLVRVNVQAQIEEFQHPMSRNCAGGTTNILVNGRELHSRDLEILARRGLPSIPGRTYRIDIGGRVVNEATGEELRGLGPLAPSYVHSSCLSSFLCLRSNRRPMDIASLFICMHRVCMTLRCPQCWCSFYRLVQSIEHHSNNTFRILHRVLSLCSLSPSSPSSAVVNWFSISHLYIFKSSNAPDVRDTLLMIHRLNIDDLVFSICYTVSKVCSATLSVALISED